MRRLSHFLFVSTVLMFAGLSDSIAQEFMGVKTTNRIVCYAHTTDNPCYVPPPEEFLALRNGARKKTSSIDVTYNPGFTPEAEAAFTYALEIWESLIVSPVPIRIDAYWSPLGASTLGSALYTSAYVNFRNAPKLNVFYPVALAEKMIGRNLNGTEPDLFVQFNSNIDWHYNPNTTPGIGQYDLVSVVLHEIAHGLGFAGTFNSNGTTGSVGLQSTNLPIIYDVPIENGNGANLIRSNPSPSAALHTDLTGNNLFFNSPTSFNPKLFAPQSFSSGSSISHLDESTFNNTNDALMTPQIAPSEKIHNPGVAFNMLQDMGWEFVRIVHQPLPDRENVSDPFVVTTQIQDDNGFAAGSVTLFYTTNGTAFTGVNMNPTGNPKEFSASIPATGTAQEYGYYITVRDNSNREFTNPGKIVRINNTEIQNLFFFETGPDFIPPTISHSPKLFLLDSETSLELEARVTDNIGVASVTVEYSVNGVTQTPQSLTLTSPGEDSIYTVSLNIGTLANGDVITYSLKAIDTSLNGNQTLSPSSGLYTLNVVGLEPTQDSYTNDFNTPSSDFFGNGFSITQPTGFNNPAIHTTHPYPEGTGFPNDQLTFVYQLKIPIRISDKDATIRFDEIVLVEPGEPGTVFGDDEFWDYVIVEGSKDGGITWTPVVNGYDARANSAWLTRYNRTIVGNISTEVGDPSLFRPRTIDLKNTFDPGDEVVIRFRLYSDPLAAGWGWAIDNLKIQIDDIPPLVLHDHIDYLKDDTDELSITTSVSDNSGIESLHIEYRINNGSLTVQTFNVNPPAANYTFLLTGLSDLNVGDLIEYKIVATDSAGNDGVFPPVGEFVQVPIISFTAPLTTYANSFNTPTTDFVGNFFSVTQPAGFTDGAIHSAHFYPNGIGLDRTSSFSYTLKKPITLSATNAYIRFDEIVIVEGHPSGILFGSENFRDYVIVEGSKDGGITWNRFIDGYDLVGGESSWNTAFTSGDNGNASMFRRRAFDLTASSSFQAGDQVLIRFRLFANETINGWGWAIDNLFIQDPITSTEQVLSGNLKIYPNPVSNELLTVERESTTGVHLVEMMTLQGQKIHTAYLYPSDGTLYHQIDVSGLPKGMYLFILQRDDGEKIIRKIIKTN